jgi:hypothetical protein
MSRSNGIACHSKEKLISGDCNDSARSAYRSLINNARTLEFTGFASNQRQQDPALPEKGRAAALHFLENGQVSTTSFSNSAALQDYLNTGTSTHLCNHHVSHESCQPVRRMIILEDLSRNHVEILGTHLRIHPAFFAAHYSDPIKTGSSGKGLNLGQSSRGSFVLQAPQMHYMKVQDQELDGSGLIYRANSHVRRMILKGAKDNPNDLSGCFGEMFNVISFWSKEYENGDWTGT